MGARKRSGAAAIKPAAEEWKYLEPRPEKWSKQLYVKGRRLKASDVWLRLRDPDAMTPKEAAQNWELPMEAIQECIHYCEANEELIWQEIREEREYLLSKGYRLEPPPFG